MVSLIWYWEHFWSLLKELNKAQMQNIITWLVARIVYWLFDCSKLYISYSLALIFFLCFCWKVTIALFWQDNVIITPLLTGTILPGITRKSIIEIAGKLGFQVGWTGMFVFCSLPMEQQYKILTWSFPFNDRTWPFVFRLKNALLR
jgi:hypothetical protein